MKEYNRKQVEDQHEKFCVKFPEDVIDKPPSRYYIVDAFGHLIFVRVRERQKAQEIINEIYGKDFYKIRFMGLEPIGGKEVNAR